MKWLYPELEPACVHSIEVQAPHVLYVEECGVLHGIAVLFLHGGPGAGCRPYHRRFFDPGRRDLTCTLEAAWSLHRAIPHSRLIVVPAAGHLASEPAMAEILVSVTDEMRDSYP
jgi:hypothetical protein